ncbi:MAG: dephospho-CoA kinase [Nitrospinaceae bacterium]|nr:MAG: dephospho-CoA kinase [Nitrospinaceae bacterium]
MGLIVGLTGSIGSGKTTAASMLKDLGAFIIDADLLCRKLVLPNRPAWEEIVETFGKTILMEDQNIDRAKLADVVFNDKEKKTLLENILHPKVIEEEMRLCRQILNEHPHALIVIDAALLIESGNYKKVDKVIVVTCDQETLVRRAMERSSLTREEAQLRIQNQMPQEEKVKKADFILENNGSRDDFQTQVEKLCMELKAAV